MQKEKIAHDCRNGFKNRLLHMRYASAVVIIFNDWISFEVHSKYIYTVISIEGYPPWETVNTQPVICINKVLPAEGSETIKL